jgi:hypothetical protein
MRTALELPAKGDTAAGNLDISVHRERSALCISPCLRSCFQFRRHDSQETLNQCADLPDVGTTTLQTRHHRPLELDRIKRPNMEPRLSKWLNMNDLVKTKKLRSNTFAGVGRLTCSCGSKDGGKGRHDELARNMSFVAACPNTMGQVAFRSAAWPRRCLGQDCHEVENSRRGREPEV